MDKRLVRRFAALFLCCAAAGLMSGCHNNVAGQAASETAISLTEYEVTGKIPEQLRAAKGVSGEAVWSPVNGFPVCERTEIKPDAAGNFSVKFSPADKSVKNLRVKLSLKSEAYAPLEVIAKVAQGKPSTVNFPVLIPKSETVHYTGVILDEITDQPVPYVGIYADSCGTEIGRADEKGYFDLYVKPNFGTVHILPWLASDKYVGHSYFLKNQPGETVDLKLIIERGIRVKVRTVDTQGKPVPGVLVRWMGSGGASGTTDKNGEATLNGMLSRVRNGFLAEVRKTGYVLAENPGPLNNMLYTEKPLQIVLRCTDENKTDGNISRDSGNVTKDQPVAALRKKFTVRLVADLGRYSKAELSAAEVLYQEASQKWGSAEAKENLQQVIIRTPKSNRAGCAMLYLGQMSSGDEQIGYFQKAIAEYDDCFYGDGAQVGALARYYLAYAYWRKGEKDKALKLFDEIRSNYADAVNHSGEKLTVAITHVNSKDSNTVNEGSTFWQRFECWQRVNRIVETDKDKNKDFKAASELMLRNLTQGVFLVKFEPVNGFSPRNAGEFLDEISRCSKISSDKVQIGSASFFRTTVDGKHLIGSFLSDSPELIKSDLGKSTTIRFISSEPVTPESFVRYLKTAQEVLPVSK